LLSEKGGKIFKQKFTENSLTAGTECFTIAALKKYYRKTNAKTHRSCFMKILITTDLYTTETNGVVTSVKNLRQELQRKGHDVRILTLAKGLHSYRAEGVYYIRSVPMGVVYPDVRMPTAYHHRLIRELIAWKPDVIHSQCEFFTFQYALHISKSTCAPIVHTYHTLYEQYVPYLFPSRRLGEQVVKVMSRRRLRKVKKVVAPTHKVEDALLGYKVKTSISVVPSGIALEQHKKRISAEERLEKRRALGIGDDETVLVNLGRLGTEKSLDELVNFFAGALERQGRLIFLIVGDGPAREGLERQAQELGIREKVIFTGMVKPGEVQSYYQLGDIFVSASTSETQGLTYVEAAANGLPLLCRADRCLQGVVLEGENGYTYTCEEEFQDKLEKMIADAPWRKAAAKRSEEIAAGFDKSAFGEKVEAVYEEVVEQK